MIIAAVVLLALLAANLYLMHRRKAAERELLRIVADPDTPADLRQRLLEKV